MDSRGLAITSSFMAVRPSAPEIELEFLWAVLNSPVANAYMHCYSMHRTPGVGFLRRMPFPIATSGGRIRVVEAARAYIHALASGREQPKSGSGKGGVCRLLMRMDAEVLRLYELPPRYERQLLDLFSGWQRPGVPVPFKEYFPSDFEPCISLHEYLSEDYARSTAGAMRERYEPVTDPGLLAALRRASEDFTE